MHELHDVAAPPRERGTRLNDRQRRWLGAMSLRTTIFLVAGGKERRFRRESCSCVIATRLTRMAEQSSNEHLCVTYQKYFEGINTDLNNWLGQYDSDDQSSPKWKFAPDCFNDERNLCTLGDLKSRALLRCHSCVLLLHQLRSSNSVSSPEATVRLRFFATVSLHITYVVPTVPVSEQGREIGSNTFHTDAKQFTSREKDSKAAINIRKKLEIWTKKDLHGRSYHRPAGASFMNLLSLEDNDREKTLDYSTGSKYSLRLAKECLHRCPQQSSLFGDESCSHAPETKIVPSRLLNVGPVDESQQPFVQVTRDLSEPTIRYVALSYCWGNSQPVKTTRSTLSARCASIALADLPLTIRHAVLVTRALGIRYLWVDALCIVQDDTDDWLRESSDMCGIYSCAAVVLIAANGKDCDSGLFVNRDGLLQWPCPLPIFVRSLNYWDEQFVIRPPFEKRPKPNVYGRAWTMQERVLARRALIFHDRGVSWICSGHTPVASELSGDASQRKLAGALTTGSAGLLIGEFGPDPTPPKLEAWLEFVEEYTARAITYNSDRLLAIAGLAELLRDKFSCAYLAGLWHDDIWAGLLWRSTNPSSPGNVNDRLQIAPSWSWASVTEPVKYDPGVTFSVSKPRRYRFVGMVSAHHHFTLCNYEISGDARCQQGVLHVQASSKRYRMKAPSDLYLSSTLFNDCAWHPDRDVGIGEELVLLVVGVTRAEFSTNQYSICCVVLEQAHTGAGNLCRLGLATLAVASHVTQTTTSAVSTEEMVMECIQPRMDAEGWQLASLSIE